MPLLVVYVEMKIWLAPYKYKDITLTKKQMGRSTTFYVNKWDKGRKHYLGGSCYAYGRKWCLGAVAIHKVSGKPSLLTLSYNCKCLLPSMPVQHYFLNNYFILIVVSVEFTSALLIEIW